jgi:hypothetical protein
MLCVFELDGLEFGDYFVLHVELLVARLDSSQPVELLLDGVEPVDWSDAVLK